MPSRNKRPDITSAEMRIRRINHRWDSSCHPGRDRAKALGRRAHCMVEVAVRYLGDLDGAVFHGFGRHGPNDTAPEAHFLYG